MPKHKFADKEHPKKMPKGMHKMDGKMMTDKEMAKMYKKGKK